MSDPAHRASERQSDRFLPMLLTLLFVIVAGMTGAFACDEDVSLGKGARRPASNGPSAAPPPDLAVGGASLDVKGRD